MGLGEVETTSTKWIENLAIEEINMDETGLVNIDGHLDPSVYLEESSIELMDTLRGSFEFYIQKFNELRGQQSQATIKIFKVSNTVNDFMLFRNSLRLVFSRKSRDTIEIRFMGPKGDKGHRQIKARVGPFHTIDWLFEGEAVSLGPLIRYYLSEFIKTSAQ